MSVGRVMQPKRLREATMPASADAHRLLVTAAGAVLEPSLEQREEIWSGVAAAIAKPTLRLVRS